MLRCQTLLSSLKGNAVKGRISNPIKTREKVPRTFKEKIDEFIRSPQGRKLRIFILTGTMVVYPIGALICNGPLIEKTFPWRFNITYELPEKLKKLIDEEYKNFLDKENRLERDAVVRFSINNDESVYDSVAKSSLSTRFGAEIALPFYVKFDNIEEATDYCKKNLKTINYFDEKLTIDWDSENGEKIIASFVLSDKAKRFLIIRDMYGNDGYHAFGNRSLGWATWTAFSGVSTYYFHQRSKLCNGTALSFVILYSFFLTFAWFGANEWYKLYRFMQDLRGDSEASKMTSDYCIGGKEYYLKMLGRNRLLCERMKGGLSKLLPSGDVKKIVTSIVKRYDLIKDVSIENEKKKEVFSMDLW
uniref:Transmembrane protein 177 n=1 Tax=Strongyloides venezuelensis TaxID=75913 RepID=A0A0K0F821_STRVS